MRRLIFATFAATSLVSGFPDSSAFATQKRIAPQTDPIALLKEIYGRYPDSEKADDWHKADKNWSPSGDVDKQPGWATLPLSRATAALHRRVAKKLEKDGFVCIDYDMVSDSQDPDIARYKITEPPAKSSGFAEYDIYFQGKSRQETRKVTYLLVQEEGKWRVEDMITYSTDAKGRAVKNDAKDMLNACLKD